MAIFGSKARGSNSLAFSRASEPLVHIEEFETLADLLPRLEKFPERPAVLAFTKEDKQQWTYGQIAQQASRLRAGLGKLGIKKGAAVAFFAENGPEWFSTCLGVLAGGAVAVPLDTQLDEKALHHSLSDSGARQVFTTKRLLKRLKPIASRCHCQPILLGEGEEGVRGSQDLLEEPNDSAAYVSPDDRAVLFYTSGTTGPPRGVPLTHANLAFQLNTLLAAGLINDDDRILLPLPLHHVYPFTIGMLTPLARGLPIVLPHTLTGPQLMRSLREGEVTTIIGVPRLYRALLDGIQAKADAGGLVMRLLFHSTLRLSTLLARVHVRSGRVLFGRIHREMAPQLRVLASGGAALDPELAWKLEGLGWLVGSGYGLTETSPLLTLDKPGEARIGSVGRPIEGVELRIDPLPDDKNGEVKEKKKLQEGEVVARGPGVFWGYHNLPDKTKEAFTDDGWFRTGDLGHVDAAGYLYITGRVKTLIVLEGGEKIQPDDLEEKYQENTVLREVGVLEREGKVVAVIRPAGGEQAADENAVRSAVEERGRTLSSYQRIADIALAKSPLPRTRLGKIRREELQKLYDELKQGGEKQVDAGPMPEEKMAADDLALLDDPAARKAWEWLAQRFPQQAVSPDTSPQLDLGIDSLEWLNLSMEIRQCCGVELTEESIGRIQSVRDLLREIGEQPQGEGRVSIDEMLESPDEVLGEDREFWLAPLGAAEVSAARCLHALNWLWVHARYRIRIEGRENLPSQRPFILAPHHVSYLDSFVLGAALDFALLRETYWAGWTGVANGPFFRVLRRLTHVVPVDPDRAAATSLAFGAAVLRRKRNLIWFPEGTLSETGKLLPLRPGIGMLLAHYPVPIVPAVIHRTLKALPRGNYIPRPGNIQITFGKSLDPHELENQGRGEEPHERITAALQDAMAELCRGPGVNA